MVRRPVASSIPVAAAVLVASLLLATVGCTRGPGDRLVGHLDAMVSLLEQHKESAEKAAEAVEAYVAEHGEELRALRAELDAKRAELSPSEVGDLAGNLLHQTGPVMERAHRLMAESPALATNERLRKALQSVSAR